MLEYRVGMFQRKAAESTGPLLNAEVLNSPTNIRKESGFCGRAIVSNVRLCLCVSTRVYKVVETIDR